MVNPKYSDDRNSAFVTTNRFSALENMDEVSFHLSFIKHLQNKYNLKEEDYTFANQLEKTVKNEQVRDGCIEMSTSQVLNGHSKENEQRYEVIYFCIIYFNIRFDF